MENVAEIKVSYSSLKSKLKITGSVSAYEVLKQAWNISIIELQEEFKVLLLNYANDVLGVYSLSKGGISNTVVDIRLLFAVALKCNATSIIVSHNHPSGNLFPSEADKTITKKIKAAGEILDIKLLDHLILTKESFYSFSENGII